MKHSNDAYDYSPRKVVMSKLTLSFGMSVVILMFNLVFVSTFTPMPKVKSISIGPHLPIFDNHQQLHPQISSSVPKTKTTTITNTLLLLESSSSTIEINNQSESKINSKPAITSTASTTSTTSTLTIEQKEFLSSLNMNVYGGAFLNKVQELLEFKNVHSSCSVPKRYKDNPALGNWVNKTRQMYRKYKEGKSSSMTSDRIKVLNEIGFIWSGTSLPNINIDTTRLNNNNNNIHHVKREQALTIQDQLWMSQYDNLREYWIRNEKSYVNLKSSQHTSLSAWVVRQRREYQNKKLGEKSTMTKERRMLLEEIDFDWSPRETNWNLKIQELIDYKKLHGDCLVPVQYKPNPKLGRWVSTQRKYYKLYENGNTSRITKAKIKQLSDLGFAWSRWEFNWTDNGSFS